jgi:hypothetical protein
MGGGCSTNGAKRNSYKLLAENPERKRPLGIKAPRCVDVIKMDVIELGCSGWNGSIWLRIRTSGGLL